MKTQGDVSPHLKGQRAAARPESLFFSRCRPRNPLLRPTRLRGQPSAPSLKNQGADCFRKQLVSAAPYQCHRRTVPCILKGKTVMLQDDVRWPEGRPVVGLKYFEIQTFNIDCQEVYVLARRKVLTKNSAQRLGLQSVLSNNAVGIAFAAPR